MRGSNVRSGTVRTGDRASSMQAVCSKHCRIKRTVAPPNVRHTRPYVCGLGGAVTDQQPTEKGEPPHEW
jgi:hypothetical protein